MRYATGALLGLVMFGMSSNGYAQTCSTQGISNTSYYGNTLPSKFIAFTYDDGPDTYSAQLAQYLNSQGIRTTFFLRGCHIPNYSGNRSLYVQLGHRVALHTETHPHLVELLAGCLPFTPAYPPPAWDAELTAVDQQISSYITDGVYLFRAPGGGWNDVDDPYPNCSNPSFVDVAGQVRNLITRNCSANPTLGKLFGPIHWTTDGADYACFQSGASAAQCAQQYVDAINATQNGIILFHDWLQFNGNANAVETAELDCVVANERTINGTTGRFKGDDKPLQLAQAVVPMLKAQGYQIVSTDAVPGLPGGQDYGPFTTVWQTEMSDSGGWTGTGYYSSIRYVDVNSDTYTDVCARTAAGIACALNNKAGHFGSLTTFLPNSQLQGLPLDDLHSRTIQFADVSGDGKPDVCWLANSTVYCAVQNAAGTFNNSTNWSTVGLFSGWEVPQYASSLYIGSLGVNPSTHHLDVGVCGRGADGVHCAVSNGTAFGAWGVPWASGFSDAAGWNGDGYYSTIRFADVTGDGIVDVCGEGFQSVFCATGDLANKRFNSLAQWTSWGRYLSDYTDDLHNASIRLARTGSANRADLCIRVGVGEVCAPNSVGKFDPFKAVYKPVNDPNGWGATAYGTTVEFVPNLTPNRPGNPISICARAIDGIHCSQHN